MANNLEGWDSIDFAFGLHDFDIHNHQPHFPGYPVYLFFSWLAYTFIQNDTISLTLPGAVFGSVAVVPIFYLAKRMFSERVALLASIIYLVNPLCWLQAEKPLSDATGFFFIILSSHLLFYACTSKRHVMLYLISGSVILGIGLGVRLSYFPFLTMWLFTVRKLSKSNDENVRVGYGIFAFFSGVSVWLLPLMYYTGLKPLTINGYEFVFGHFTDWGGTALTSPNLFTRISYFMWSFFCSGLGFWCNDTSFIRVLPSIVMVSGMIIFMRHVRFDFTAKFMVIYTVPYLLWVFFGQNLEKPRHIVPLIPFVIICISAGLERLRVTKYSFSKRDLISFCCRRLQFPQSFAAKPERSRLSVNFNKWRHKYDYFSPYYVSVCILFMSMSFICVSLVHDHKNKPIAQIQLLDYIKSNYDSHSTRIYCWETKRFFDYYAPVWDTRMVRNIDDLQYDREASLIIPETILSTSKVNGINLIVKESNIVAVFKNDRYSNNPYHTLVLYNLSAQE
ncbi:MAG: glycosyltransferase family 39 protein [Candidatus Scalindua sp.]|nr:glycosyltransferase family 39 protein [Candidatus Scalindua sp.]